MIVKGLNVLGIDSHHRVKKTCHSVFFTLCSHALSIHVNIVGTDIFCKINMATYTQNFMKEIKRILLWQSYIQLTQG